MATIKLKQTTASQLFKRFSFPVFIFFVFILAWFEQLTLFLNWDVSMLLNETQQLLNGGTYSNDFFTPNPPMIFYIYSIPVVLTNYLNVSLIYFFPIYIFFIAFISFMLVMYLSKIFFLSKETFLKNLFCTFLLMTFLLTPFYHFGQREHLLYLLTIPYCLLMALRLKDNQVNLLIAILVGIFAACGFGIKPQFIFILFMLESFYLFQKKSWRVCLRPEFLTLLTLLSLYTISIIIFFPDYLTVILPYMIENYYDSIGLPWSYMLLSRLSFFCLYVLALTAIQYKQNDYQDLLNVFSIYLLGGLFCFIIQRTYFAYHMIPAFSTAFVLLLFISFQFQQHYKHWFNLLFGLIVMLFPIFFCFQFYKTGLDYKKNVLMPLIAYMHTQSKNTSIYFLSQANYSAPLMHYVNARVDQRFDCLWMVCYFINRYKNDDQQIREIFKTSTNHQFFLNMVVEDLQKHAPNLVFVDISSENVWLGGKSLHFDYLNHFLENTAFKKIWHSYQYITTIHGENNSYVLEVYKHV